MNEKRKYLQWIAGITTAAGLAFAVGAFSTTPASSQQAGPGDCPLDNLSCGNADDESQPSIANGVKNGLVNGVPNGIDNGVPNGVPNGVTNGVPNGVPNGVGNGVPNGITNGSNPD